MIHYAKDDKAYAATLYLKILAAVNLHLSLQYLVLAICRKEGQLALLRPDRGEVMQDSAYVLRRVPLSPTVGE